MKTPRFLRNLSGHVILPLVFMTLFNGLQAQTVFPGGDYWSLDAGFGMTDILVEGLSYQFVMDPKIWISPPLMVGNRLGVNYSTDKILSLENQLYLRWNFLRLGSPEKTTNFFVQGGVGLLAAYRGKNEPFSDVTKNRGSFMADAEAGITIPLSSTWHIEPAIRGGYPHIAGVSVTMGAKIPSRAGRNTYTDTTTTYVYSSVPSAVKCVMFGPNTGQYNADIDRSTRKQNEQVLNDIAQTLIKNPDYHVRIEGHANPVTNNPSEDDRLMALSKTRADAVADLLMERGVTEKQMDIIAFGGTRTITGDHDHWNRNRRVEMIVFQDTTE